MLHRIEAVASRMLGVIASVAMFAMMLLTFFDVIGRYGFHKSIFGVAEIVEHLMILTVFAGLAFITAKNEHITVTLFEPLLQRYAGAAQRWASILISIGCTLLITWEMLQHALDSMRSGKRTAVLDLPQWHLPMSAAFLSLVGLALLIVAVIRSRGRLGATAISAD